MDARAPIGILDSGVGGFTEVKALRQLLPQEELIFYGDGKNVPYGNRSPEEILHLARQCLDVLAKRGVKMAAVACNTISALVDTLQEDCPFPLFSIVQAGGEAAAARAPRSVGVFSTVFTARSGCYERAIQALSPGTRVYVQGSARLAELIEAGSTGPEELFPELDGTLGCLAREHPETDTLILGCTHFPIVSREIQRYFPQFAHIIDPAEGQAGQIGRYLERSGALNHGGAGGVRVYTSGDCGKYARLADRMGIEISGGVEQLPAPVPLREK